MIDKDKIKDIAYDMINHIETAFQDLGDEGEDDYEDPDVIADIAGDRICDEATLLMPKKSYKERCPLMIQIAEAIIESHYHIPMKTAMNQLIQEWDARK